MQNKELELLLNKSFVVIVTQIVGEHMEKHLWLNDAWKCTQQMTTNINILVARTK